MRDQQAGGEEGERHRDERRQPHQRRQWGFVVHVVGGLIASLDDRGVEEVRDARGDDHHDAHREDPYQQLHLDERLVHAEQNERDQRDAGHAVRLEAIGAGADGIAGIVAGAVGDHARIARVVLFDLEDDLHEVRTDVGDLREDAARYAQRRVAGTRRTVTPAAFTVWASVPKYTATIAPMKTQRIRRKRPCVSRYVLQVS